MKSDLKPIAVKGKIFFARDLNVFNKMFDEDNDRYFCTVGELSEAACEALKEAGIQPKERDPAGKHIKAKSKYLFKFYDAEGTEIPSAEIGSGTEVVAYVTPYAHKLSKKWGMGTRIQKLKVVNLVKYDPSMADAEEEVEAL